jgi:CubicO group peptidase (beta-lactamase class C family)
MDFMEDIMKRWVKRSLFAVGIALIILLVGAGWYLSDTLPIGTGHTAKTICSNVFISGRDAQDVFKEDIAPLHFLFAITDFKVDSNAKSVSADAFGFAERKAIYREGCGCTIVNGLTEDELRQQEIGDAKSLAYSPEQRSNRPWPAGNHGPVVSLPADIDAEKLAEAMDAAFAEPGPENLRKTRAVVVVYNGQLIAERYAPGFNLNTPQLGWSMSKSVTTALVGLLVQQDKLELHSPAPVPEWQKANDPRHKITLDQLLRMSAGLEFDEEYAPFSDAVYMFYDSYDFAAYAANKPLETEPDAKWHYSSGTANIISRIVRQTIEKEHENYYEYLYQKLFHKIGMFSVVLEPDPSGTFVGSSYTFATPRDWARFGLLYLQDGVWNRERILPEGWVKYTTTPTPRAPQGEYGALFWLNAGLTSNASDRMMPSIPRDTFFADGFQGQRVFVVPSKNLVLVRFGATSVKSAWNDEAFVASILAALPE